VAGTSPNRPVNASPPLAARATQKRSRRKRLCAFLFRHIFLFAKNADAFSLSQTKIRRLQPERYTKCALKGIKGMFIK
jgi:hypothetical protein